MPIVATLSRTVSEGAKYATGDCEEAFPAIQVAMGKLSTKRGIK
jgi:hypothetical protein